MELSVATVITAAAGGIVALPVLTYITFLFWPSVVLRAYNWYHRHRLGLVVRRSHCGSYRFSYYTRGTPVGTAPPLLMLHGFSANKDVWMPIVKYLPRSQQVVCVDMPGHMGTSRTGAEDYCIEGQVARIHQFVCSIGLDKRPFHLVGQSMGGNVAGVYAARYPAHLSSVTLICPAGLVYPTDSEFICRLKEIEKSQNTDSIPLIPSTLEGYEDMMRLCFHTPLNIPRQVLKGLLSDRIQNNGFYKELFMELIQEKSRHSLQENLHLITTPLQVIWGKEDKLLDVSGAAALQAVLPSCHVELLDNCGHTVNFERPRKTAKLIMNFFSAQVGSEEDAKKRC